MARPATGGKPDIKPGTGDYRLTWEKVEVDGQIVHKPETAGYVCRDCGVVIEERHKHWMVRNGRWVKHNPSSKYAGFHITGLIATMGDRWSELAAKWLEVKDDAERRKPFFNTKLGLLYVASWATSTPRHSAAGARNGTPKSRRFVGVLTAGIDVQGDRIEMEVRGWARKKESVAGEARALLRRSRRKTTSGIARARCSTSNGRHESGAQITIAPASWIPATSRTRCSAS
jgi:phage terminase large subunit GpA-like protein